MPTRARPYGCSPVDSDELRCEKAVAQAVKKLAGAIVKCHVDDARRLLATGNGPAPLPAAGDSCSALAKATFDSSIARLALRGTCPGHVVDDAAAVRDSLVADIHQDVTPVFPCPQTTTTTAPSTTTTATTTTTTTTTTSTVTSTTTPCAAVRSARHGGSIVKDCRDPRGQKSPQPGEVVTCTIAVCNVDTFGDSIRIDRIVDTIQRGAGPQVDPIALPLDLPPDLRGACVGGTRAGSDCACPGGTCGTGAPRLCAGGTRDGLQCDCPGGTCTTVVPDLGQYLVVSDTYVADAGVMGALTDDVVAEAADLGLGNPTVLCQNSQPTPACFQPETSDRLVVTTTMP